jgi:hypothetical protein
MGWVMPASEKSRHPPDALPERKTATPARHKPKVRSRKPLPILPLTATSSVLPYQPVQPGFGIGIGIGIGHCYPAPWQNQLPFFKLLSNLTTDPPPHNRAF